MKDEFVRNTLDPKNFSPAFLVIEEHVHYMNMFVFETFTHISSKEKFGNDWGFILRYVLWTRGETFNETTITYVFYIESHFVWNCHIILHGYEEVGLKSMQHQRRYTKCAPDKTIHGYNAITISQELFLSNSNNKRQFIHLLCVKLWRRYMGLLECSFVHKLNKHCI